jgi:hypothetical protein
MGIGHLLAIFPLKHGRYAPIPQNTADDLVANFLCVLCTSRSFGRILTKTFPGMLDQVACRRVSIHEATDHTTTALGEAMEDMATAIIFVLNIGRWLVKAIDRCVPFFKQSCCL